MRELHRDMLQSVTITLLNQWLMVRGGAIFVASGVFIVHTRRRTLSTHCRCSRRPRSRCRCN